MKNVLKLFEQIDLHRKFKNRKTGGFYWLHW